MEPKGCHLVTALSQGGAQPSITRVCVTCVGASSDSSPDPPAGFSVGFFSSTAALAAAAFFAFSFFRENSGIVTDQGPLVGPALLAPSASRPRLRRLIGRTHWETLFVYRE